MSDIMAKHSYILFYDLDFIYYFLTFGDILENLGRKIENSLVFME